MIICLCSLLLSVVYFFPCLVDSANYTIKWTSMSQINTCWYFRKYQRCKIASQLYHNLTEYKQESNIFVAEVVLLENITKNEKHLFAHCFNQEKI